ncbi:MAG: hypothetical protein HQ500_06670 [Flavobacteriales bacterium]|nr:hypothetical protein [Flavobacteriales bacterium]
MRRFDFKEILETTCRFYVFVFLSMYGIGKIIGGQFYTAARIPDEIAQMPIGLVPDFELAWTFMGRSFGYILIIALAEIIGAFLLLFHKTKLFGVLILIPIMVNVIVFDIFFLDEYGALAGASLYLLMLLTIVVLNKEKMNNILKELLRTQVPPKTSSKEKFLNYLIVLVIMVLIFIGDQFIVGLFGYGKG